MSLSLDHTLLAAALEGLERKKERVEAQIADLKARLSGKTPKAALQGESAAAAPAPAPRKAKKKRNLSASARQRIADAQKRRWAARSAGHAGESAPAVDSGEPEA